MPLASSSDSAPPFLSSRPEFLCDLGVACQTRLTSQWISTDSGRLHSRTADARGTDPFVLIHGLVISSLYMMPLAECLAIDHEVHALDLPGFGRSGKPRETLAIPQLAEAVVGWLRARGIDRCHFVANSMGCQVVAHVAVRAPELVLTLTFIGATIDPSARGLGTQVLRLIRDAIREPPRLWMNWIFDFARAGVLRACGTTRRMFADRIEELLPYIKAPTLILRGDLDPTMPMEWGQRAAAGLPNGRLRVIPSHGHCVHYTAPVLTSDAILQHCASYYYSQE